MFRYAVGLMIVMTGLSSQAIGADNTKRTTESSIPKVSLEQERAEAIRQVDEFGRTMCASDPECGKKEQKILYALPMIAKMFPPSQWVAQIKFLYGALTEIDRQEKQNDPDSVLSKFYPDEAKRAPGNVQSMSSTDRTPMVERRLGELSNLFNSGEIGLQEHAARALAVALVYFPYDQRFIVLRRHKLELTLQLARGEIDQAKFDMLWDIRRREFNANASQQQQAEVAQKQAIEAQGKAAPSQLFGDILRGAALGLRNSASEMQSQQPTRCTSYAVGGVIQTTCH